MFGQPASAYPGPFKCAECGVWWAGFEHRCQLDLTKIVATGGSWDFTVRCTCPPDRGDNYAGTCPVHDVQVTYTQEMASSAGGYPNVRS